MKTKLIIALLSFVPVPVFAQDSATVCSRLENSVHCTTYADTIPQQTQESQKDLNNTLDKTIEKARWAGALRAAERQAKSDQQFADQEEARRQFVEQDNRSILRFLYCRKHPDASIVFETREITCAEDLEEARTYCALYPAAPWTLCHLAHSKAEVEDVFANLNKENHGKKATPDRSAGYAKTQRWACVSFPDMTFKWWDGSIHPCLDASQ